MDEKKCNYGEDLKKNSIELIEKIPCSAVSDLEMIFGIIRAAYETIVNG